MNAALPAQSFDWRLEWRWLLALSFLLLLPAKNLWNVPIVVVAVLGFTQLVRGQISFRGEAGGPNRIIAAVFAAIWLPMLLSLPSAVAFDHSATVTAEYVRFFFFGLGIMWLLSDPRCRRRLTIAVFVVAAFWTVDALFQALAGFNFLGYDLNPRRLQGIFYPRYRLGVASACLAPIWFEGWRLIAARTENRLIIPLALLAALALPAVVLLSGSRSAWLMLGAAISLYSIWLVFLAHRAGRIKITIVVIGLMVGAIVATAASDEGFRSRFAVSSEIFSGDFKSADKATAHRLSIWKPAVAMFSENPATGIGPRGYRYAFGQYAEADNFWRLRKERGATHPHLQWLEIAAEAGLVGVIGLIIILFLIARLSLLYLRESNSVALMWTLSLALVWLPTNVHSAMYAGYWASTGWWTVSIAAVFLLARKPRTTTGDHCNSTLN